MLFFFSTGICYVGTMRQSIRLQGYLLESVHTFQHFVVSYAQSNFSDTACMTNVSWRLSILGWNLYILILFTNEMYNPMTSKGFVRHTVFPGRD